jgi:hypothetical protein
VDDEDDFIMSHANSLRLIGAAPRHAVRWSKGSPAVYQELLKNQSPAHCYRLVSAALQKPAYTLPQRADDRLA